MAAPKTQLTCHDLVAALFAEGRFEEAAQALSEAIAEGATVELWNDWAAAQAHLGRFIEAEQAFRQALSLDAANSMAAANLGALLFSQGRKREALHFLEQALRDPQVIDRGLLESLAAQAHESATAVAAAPGLAPQLPASASYDDWFESVFGKRVPVPGVRVAASWNEDTHWGSKAHTALVGVECEYVRELLKEIQAKNIEGDITEFGVFRGWWLNYLWQATEDLGLRRRIYGFDSFEGLSEPHPQYDSSFWKKGQYACSLAEVAANVQAAVRPRIRLVKGFFEKSLRGPDALLAEKFAYVRIDCDIYEPALDCLRYVGPRLSDGAVLIFDDWPHSRGIGEQRAFEEWLPTVPHLAFEFLFHGTIGHFYLRVHHRK